MLCLAANQFVTQGGMLMSCGQIRTDHNIFRFRLLEAGVIVNMHLSDRFSADQDGFHRLRLTFFQTTDQSLRYRKTGIVVGMTLVFCDCAKQISFFPEIACIRVVVQDRSLCSRRSIAGLLMDMDITFRQKANQMIVLIIATGIMSVGNVICPSTDQSTAIVAIGTVTMYNQALRSTDQLL